MAKFEEINIGDSAEIKHLITQDDIVKFVELTGDDNKLHVDETYASTTNFKKPVVHGMLGASFISTIIGTKIPGDGALWFSQTIEFLLPVRVGDELKITAEVIKKVDQLRIIELKTEIFNQHKQKVTTGVAKVKIVEPENAPNKVEKTKEVSINALIIGGTGGIGSATAIKLASNGFNISIHYNTDKKGAEQLAAQLGKFGVKVATVTGALGTTEEVHDLLKSVERKLGEVDVFVNCGAIKIPNLNLEKLDWQDFQRHIDLNVKTNFLFAQLLAPSMKKRKNGKFIFLTSQVTESTPPAEWASYTTAKYALNGFAKSLAVELAPFNIQVNLVSPGMTETNLISDISDRAKLLAAAKTPLKRLASPEDVANVVLFLASSNSDYITGETIRVSGGLVMI
jgi:3-oxoacyl-[acyl-carrier protein] reductase